LHFLLTSKTETGGNTSETISHMNAQSTCSCEADTFFSAVINEFMVNSNI